MKSWNLLAGAALGVAVFAPYSFPQDRENTSAGPAVKLVSAVDIDEKFNGESARASTVEVTFEPGDFSPPHRHPGAVFGYVVEGELQFKVADQPQRSLKAGDTFYEPKNVLHEVARNPSHSARTRIVVVIIHPREAKQLVIPASPKPN